jgi:hypothetical protein
MKTCCRKEWRKEVVARRPFEVVASGNRLRKPDFKMVFMIATT